MRIVVFVGNNSALEMNICRFNAFSCIFRKIDYYANELPVININYMEIRDDEEQNLTMISSEMLIELVGTVMNISKTCHQQYVNAL